MRTPVHLGRSLRTTGLLLVFPVIGCREATSPPLAAFAPHQLPVAAAGSGTSHSRAHITLHATVNVGSPSSLNWVPSGIQGDGRNRFGQADAVSEYQGDFCGVRTVVYDYQKPYGGINFDTDTDYDALTMSGPCGSRRTIAFSLGGPTPVTSSPNILVKDLWNFAPGESRLMNVTIGQGLPCSTLQFDAQYAGAGSARVTRLPDVSGARQWVVESQGTHQAACMKQLKSDRQADTGVRYYLPFAMTITQVPYPNARYP